VPTEAAPSPDLALRENGGDGHDCLAGPSQPADAPAHVDVRQAQFTSDADNALINLGFDVPDGDVAAAAAESGLLWSIQIGVYNSANARPAADPNVFASDFINEGFGFNYFAGTAFPVQQFRFVDGQWTVAENPAGVMASFELVTGTVTIPIAQLPAVGTLYLVVSSDNQVCDRVGAAADGAAIAFQKAAGLATDRSIIWSVVADMELPDASQH
jgi:hypothetical protein